jgi:multiple sugar transport system permease protein
MTATPRQRMLWLIGIVAVLLYALIPVVWMISLSLKPGDQLSDGRFFPQTISFENY